MSEFNTVSTIILYKILAYLPGLSLPRKFKPGLATSLFSYWYKNKILNTFKDL